jgi:hypothetical protein
MKQLIALTLVCATAAACGSSSSRLSAAAYRQKLATIAKRADRAQHDVERAIHAKTASEIHTRLNAFATADDRLGNEIAALKAPKDAEGANSALAHAEHDMARSVHAILPRVAQAKNATSALALLQRDTQAAKAGHELDTALAHLEKLGYTKGS